MFISSNYFRNLDDFMTELDKNDKLIEEEWLQMGRVLIGCTKLIDNITSINPKIYSKARSHHQTKSLVYTTTYYSLPRIIKEKPKFRPYDIKRNFPKEMQKIEDAYFTRIFNSFVNINRLTKANNITDAKGKRGHPSKNNNNTTSISGVKSFYQNSSYHDSLEKVLAKAEVRKHIYNLLLESGLLHRYLKHIKLISFYIIKANDKEAAWNIIKSTKPPNMKAESKFEADFESDQKKIGNIYDDKKLEEIAEIWAKSFIKNHKEDDFINMYKAGGLRYYLN